MAPVDARTPAPLGLDTLERGISIVVTIVVSVSTIVVVVVLGTQCGSIVNFDVFHCLLELFHFVRQVTNHIFDIIHTFTWSVNVLFAAVKFATAVQSDCVALARPSKAAAVAAKAWFVC